MKPLDNLLALDKPQPVGLIARLIFPLCTRTKNSPSLLPLPY